MFGTSHSSNPATCVRKCRCCLLNTSQAQLRTRAQRLLLVWYRMSKQSLRRLSAGRGATPKRPPAHVKANQLRAMARRLRGDLRTNTSESNDCAGPRRPTRLHRRAQVDLTPRQREVVRLIRASGRLARPNDSELTRRGAQLE